MCSKTEGRKSDLNYLHTRGRGRPRKVAYIKQLRLYVGAYVNYNAHMCQLHCTFCISVSTIALIFRFTNKINNE